MTGLEQALRLVRARARRRREARQHLLALELDLVAAELAELLGRADTANMRAVRCPKCRAVVTVRRPTQ